MGSRLSKYYSKASSLLNVPYATYAITIELTVENFAATAALAPAAPDVPLAPPAPPPNGASAPPMPPPAVH